MFEEWLKTASVIAAVMLMIAILEGGIAAFMPLLIGGGVVFMLFHTAKGFAQADSDSRSKER